MPPTNPYTHLRQSDHDEVPEPNPSRKLASNDENSHLFSTRRFKQAYLSKIGDPKVHGPSDPIVLGSVYYDRRIVPVPDGFARPNRFSVFARCVREFVFSFFLQFAGAIAVTDPTNTPSTIVTALAVSFTLPQFIGQIASYGTLGNTWLLFVNMALMERSLITEGELLYTMLAAGSQLAGGLVAMLGALAVRGSIEAYIAQPGANNQNFSPLGIMVMETIFCFMYGYLWLKLIRTSPKGEPPLVDTPYAPVAFAAFSFLAILTLAPFTGAGFTLIRSLAPSIVTNVWPPCVLYSIAGQFFGFLSATLCFWALYAHPA
jgi:hypothetical protein